MNKVGKLFLVCMVVAVAFFCMVIPVWAFVFGRDVQPVSITGSTEIKLSGDVATETTLSEIKGLLEDTASDTVVVERITVTGYSETNKTYGNIKKIKVFLQSAGKKIRLAFGGNDTSNNYLVIDEAKALGWTSPDVNFDTFDIKLKGDTDTDTAVVVIEAWGTK